MCVCAWFSVQQCVSQGHIFLSKSDQVWESSSNQSWPVSDSHRTTFKLPDFDSNPSISSKYFFKPVSHGSGVPHPVYKENGVDKITHVRREVTLILSMIHTAQPVLLTRPINNKDVCTLECFFTHHALGTEACVHVWIFMNVCILLARRLSQKVWLKMTLSHLTKLEDMSLLCVNPCVAPVYCKQLRSVKPGRGFLLVRWVTGLHSKLWSSRFSMCDYVCDGGGEADVWARFKCWILPYLFKYLMYLFYDQAPFICCIMVLYAFGMKMMGLYITICYSFHPTTLRFRPLVHIWVADSYCLNTTVWPLCFKHELSDLFIYGGVFIGK